MNPPIPLATPTQLVGNLIRRSFLRGAFVLVTLAVVCFGCLPAPAVSPPPDGAYIHGNTAEGEDALFNLDTGVDNTAIGAAALYSNTGGSQNTATGSRALNGNTSGDNNTANGVFALAFNTSGSDNMATGFSALELTTTGNDNTAAGSKALQHNNGDDNTANGFSALLSNTTGNFNTATGSQTLFSNVAGSVNTADGAFALMSNTSGNNNTAIGFEALSSNTTGGNNAAVGLGALGNNTTGSNNTGDGVSALGTNSVGHDNTADGFQALINNKGGSNNIAFGSKAGINLTTGSNNIDIGAPGVAAEANTIRVGKQGTQKATYIAAISGVAVSGVQVVVNSSGKLGIATSSARFKEQIKPMGNRSKAILALNPVTFCYKEEIDPDKMSQFGLIAEEVEKIDPDLVVRDDDGKVNAVRYETVNAMLLNEFLKEHRKVEEQGATIGQLKKQIEILTAGLQEVSSQLKLSKNAPQLVTSR